MSHRIAHRRSDDRDGVADVGRIPGREVRKLFALRPGDLRDRGVRGARGRQPTAPPPSR